MPADVTCPSCALQFRPRPSLGGQPQRCPRCGTAVAGAAAPSPAPAPPPAPALASPLRPGYRCSACGGTFGADLERVPAAAG